MPTEQTRRRFLASTAVASTAVASVAGLIRTSPVLAAESRLETTTVRLVRDPTIYLAPQYIAEELLHADGITDIRYIEAASDAETSAILAQGGAEGAFGYGREAVRAVVDATSAEDARMILGGTAATWPLQRAYQSATERLSSSATGSRFIVVLSPGA